MTADMFNMLAGLCSVLGLPAGLAGLWYAYKAWRKVLDVEEQQQRALQPIAITVECGGERVTLAYRPLRGQVSRAELLGIFGLFGGKERFDPDTLLSVLCSGKLSRVVGGDSAELVVALDKNQDDSLFARIKELNATCQSR